MKGLVVWKADGLALCAVLFAMLGWFCRVVALGCVVSVWKQHDDIRDVDAFAAVFAAVWILADSCAADSRTLFKRARAALRSPVPARAAEREA